MGCRDWSGSAAVRMQVSVGSLCCNSVVADTEAAWMLLLLLLLSHPHIEVYSVKFIHGELLMARVNVECFIYMLLHLMLQDLNLDMCQWRDFS